MSVYSEDQKRKIIFDYYQNKRNRVDSFDNKSYKDVYVHSSSCVDEVTLYYDKNKEDFKMVSKGCAIFLSSSEIFIERLKEVGIDKLKTLLHLYTNLVEKKPLTDTEREILGKLNIFENVSRHLNKKECALLIVKALEKIK